MKEIEQFATQFRRAIDLALEAGEFDNDYNGLINQDTEHDIS